MLLAVSISPYFAFDPAALAFSLRPLLQRHVCLTLLLLPRYSCAQGRGGESFGILDHGNGSLKQPDRSHRTDCICTGILLHVHSDYFRPAHPFEIIQPFFSSYLLYYPLSHPLKGLLTLRRRISRCSSSFEFLVPHLSRFLHPISPI